MAEREISLATRDVSLFVGEPPKQRCALAPKAVGEELAMSDPVGALVSERAAAFLLEPTR